MSAQADILADILADEAPCGVESPVPGLADRTHAARVELAQHLRRQGYRFTAVTPATHARVNAQAANAQAQELRDIFGWSRPFSENLLSPTLRNLLERAGALETDGDRLRSTIRFATLDDLLFMHSAYPTLAADSVFFGPDSYRFARLVQQALRAIQDTPHTLPHTLVDIGCGSGVGGLVAVRALDNALGKPPSRIVLADINSQALAHARVNAELNGFTGVEHVASDVLESVSGPIDLIVANPPYLSDPAHRVYRDGGGEYGCELSVRIVRESLDRLAPGGRLVLYTGAAIAGGVDLFARALAPLLNVTGVHYDYFEIDPDVFGEELETAAYAGIERIAAVGVVIHKRPS